MFDSDQQTKTKQIFPRKKPYYITQISALQKIRQISSGSFGKVFQYYYPIRNQIYAIKRMKFKGRSDYRNIRDIQTQIDLLYKTNDCPYLIKLLDHYQQQNTTNPNDFSYIYLITQFIDGKNLCDAILKPKIQHSYQIICQMILDISSGLQYLHQNNIVHRDIKLQNIMLSSKGTIKIIDLGQSNKFGQDIIRKTIRGTKSYFSPQIINHQQQDDKLDVWCLGVIIYQLICLQSPFIGNTDKQIFQNVRRFRYPIPQKIKNQKQLLDLFNKIFTWQIQRINIQQLKNHSFIKKIEKYRAKVMKIKDQNKELEKLVEKCKEQNQKYKKQRN